jgi:hypothetical protein
MNRKAGEPFSVFVLRLTVSLDVHISFEREDLTTGLK